MDENKHPNQSEAKESKELNSAPKGALVKQSAQRKVLSKRWMYPALYLGAAALIIGLMYIKSQMGTTTPVSTNVTTEGSNPAVPASTTQTEQAFGLPASTGTQIMKTLGFFPAKGTPAEQAKAMVNFDKGWYAHEGYDIKSQTGKPFTVVAAASGTVTKVTKDNLYGTTVEVSSDNGYIETYQSLASASVKAGDNVRQGEALGVTGTCQFEASQGNHLYFQVTQNGTPVDPGTVLPKF